MSRYQFKPTLGNAMAVDEALQEISDCANSLPELPVLYAPPNAPAVGTLVIADGTDWNPGSGRGVYYYDGSWTKL